MKRSSKKTNRPLTLLAVLLSLFMSAIELTVVSTAMPTVSGDLGGLHLYAWVFTVYLLGSTVTVPIFGKLADLFGRKPVLLVGLFFFLAGSLGCGLSASMPELIFFRAVQGLGAGSLQPTTLTIIGDIYSLKERARVQGMTSAVWGFSGLLGPLLGGYIVDWLSWHWIFILNLPFGLIAAALFIFCFHEEVERRRPSLDLAGALTLTAAILCLLAATERGPWGLWPGVVALVLVPAFLEIERRAKDPILPLDIFTSRIIAASSMASAFFGASMLVAATYIPLFVQAVLGGTPTEAGVALTPMVVGWPLCSAISGRLVPSIGFRLPIRIGFGTTALAALGVALFLGKGTPIAAIQALMFFFGAGMGFANTALILAVQTSVDWRHRGVATAGTMFFRTIGGTLAVGIIGGILAGLLAGQADLPPNAADLLLGPGKGAGLGQEVLQRLSLRLASGLHFSFWLMAALAAGAFVVGLFFPPDGGLTDTESAAAPVK